MHNKPSFFISRLASILSLSLGLMVLIGWACNIDALKSVLPGLISLKPNTALCFMLGGIALYAQSAAHAGRLRQIVNTVAAALILLIGAASFVQYFFDIELGIDELLFQVQPGASFDNTHPARMTPRAALSFVSLGAALLLLKTRTVPKFAQILALAVFGVALMTLAGYSFGYGVLPSQGFYKPMSIPATVGFLFLSTGILAMTLDVGLMAQIRKLLPYVTFGIAVLLLLMSATATLSNMYRATELGQKHNRIYEALLQLETVATEIELNIAGYRGYVITGQDRFTAPLAFSRTRIANALAEVHRLIEHPERRRQLAVLEKLIERRIVMCDEKIRLRKEQGAEVAAAAVAGGTGETLNEELRLAIDDFVAKEKAALSHEQARAKASNHIAVIALIVTLVAGFLVMIMVLVGLKRVQTDLQQFKTTLDLTRDCVFMFDPDTLQFFYTNQGAIDHVGYTAEELLNMTPVDIKPLFDAQRFRAMIAPMIAGRTQVLNFETLHRHKDGHDIDVEIALQYVAPADEAPRFIAIVRDISERKNAEIRLRASEASLKEAQRMAQIGSWKLDLSNRRLEWSEEVFRIFEIDASRFEGSYDAFLHAIHPDDRATVDRAYWDSVYYRRPYQIVHRLLMADGRIKYVREQGETVYEGDKALSSFGTVQDITAAKLAEDELLQYRNDLEVLVNQRTSELKAVNQELEAFAYSVSHDLRAPLRSIDGFSQALLEDYPDKLDQVGKDYLNRVRTNSQRMGSLIDDLLDLSRISRAALKNNPVSLTDLANEALKALREAEPARQTESLVQEGVIVEGDAGLLKVALVNLLGNAWKYSSKQPQPRIEFGSTRLQNETVYFVSDNGVGFDMEYSNKLFGAFQRLHSRQQFEGNGIGLATVKRIVHRHGGRIWAESAPHQKTTFYFTLSHAQSETPLNQAALGDEKSDA